METMKSTKKTVIDLKEETFRILSVIAAQQGISLKNHIEELLDSIAEERDDNETFAWLSKNNPDGDTFLSPEEQAETEKWLGL